MVFDSDVDIGPEFGPGTNRVNPHAQWLWPVAFTGGDRTPTDPYWFSIRTTSPNLVPSIEFVEQGKGEEEQVFARCAPGDFALFHRKVRLLPGVLVPETGLILTTN